MKGQDFPELQLVGKKEFPSTDYLGEKILF